MADHADQPGAIERRASITTLPKLKQRPASQMGRRKTCEPVPRAFRPCGTNGAVIRHQLVSGRAKITGGFLRPEADRLRPDRDLRMWGTGIDRPATARG